MFDGIQAGIAADRPAFLSGFLGNFFNTGVLGGKRISDEALHACWNIAVGASPRATSDCVKAWLTDFRADLRGIDVPVLVVHGDADRIVPIEVSGRRTHELTSGSRLVVLKDGPHGITWPHGDEVNRALLEFLA